jgi:hypothetical protein
MVGAWPPTNAGSDQNGRVMEDSELRRSIREKIRDGTLPARPPRKLWAGRGTGRKCAGCEQPIRKHEVEIEVEDREARLLFFFHRGCQAVWDEEVKTL